MLWADGYKSLVENLKTKFKKCEKIGEKIKILTLVPAFWTVEKVCHEFNATKYEGKKARELLKQEGVLPELTYKVRDGIAEDIKAKVVNFYENDENTRICPGEKDCISIQNKSGEKEKKTKKINAGKFKRTLSTF